jgi:hypothetical protein
MSHPVFSGIIAAMLLCAPAQAAVRITHDMGGDLINRAQQWETVRKSRQRVIIDGPCVSACTIVLQIVPLQKVCVTPRASFGFHLVAWVNERDPYARPIQDVPGTRRLVKKYPKAFRRWIASHGPLRPEPVYMRGDDLRGVLKSC